MRVFSRTRWWCTAAVISSDGIGARFSSQSRSESTMIRAPAAIALLTLVRSSSIACRRAGPPPLTSKWPVIRTAAKPGRSPSSSMCRILASSSLSMTGNGTVTCRHDAGVALSRFCSGPKVRPRLVTSSSRMASSGGLVTWANSWPK